jgi:hypothetical protein
LFVNHAQELRDTHITAKGPAAPADAAEVELWEQQALAHLRVQVQDTEEMMKRAAATKKAKKLHRVPAHDYGLALGHAMTVCGCPLDDFQAGQVPDDPKDYKEEVAATLPRTLAIASDQGTIGSCLLWYLAYQKRVRCLILWDPSHRVWNDIKHACQMSHLWPHVLLMTAVINHTHGPWNGSAFWEQSRDAAEMYIQRSSEVDPLFLAFLPGILADKGMSHRAAEPGIEKEVFESFLAEDCWKNRGTKVALARWFGFMKAAAGFDKTWNVRALALLFLGIKVGYIDIDSKANLLPLEAATRNIRPCTPQEQTQQKHMVHPAVDCRMQECSILALPAFVFLVQARRLNAEECQQL